MNFEKIFNNPVMFRGLTVTKPTLVTVPQYREFFDAMPPGWMPVGVAQLDYIHTQNGDCFEELLAQMPEGEEAQLAWEKRAAVLSELYDHEVVRRYSPDPLALQPDRRWWCGPTAQVERHVGPVGWEWRTLLATEVPCLWSWKAYAIAVRLK